jgi:hypothetical protein
MIIRKILDLMLTPQLALDANGKKVILQIFTNLTKKGLCHKKLSTKLEVKDVQA